jgi:hypothetical protein
MGKPRRPTTEPTRRDRRLPASWRVPCPAPAPASAEVRTVEEAELEGVSTGPQRIG